MTINNKQREHFLTCLAEVIGCGITIEESWELAKKGIDNTNTFARAVALCVYHTLGGDVWFATARLADAIDQVYDQLNAHREEHFARAINAYAFVCATNQ